MKGKGEYQQHRGQHKFTPLEFERKPQPHLLRGFGRNDKLRFLPKQPHRRADKRGREHGTVQHNNPHGIYNGTQGIEPERPRVKIIKHGREKENHRRNNHPLRVYRPHLNFQKGRNRQIGEDEKGENSGER